MANDMKSDKINKFCYLPYLCDEEDCCLCKVRFLNSPMKPIPEDIICDLAIDMWKMRQTVRQMEEKINEKPSKNDGN